MTAGHPLMSVISFLDSIFVSHVRLHSSLFPFQRRRQHRRQHRRRRIVEEHRTDTTRRAVHAHGPIAAVTYSRFPSCSPSNISDRRETTYTGPSVNDHVSIQDISCVVGSYTSLCIIPTDRRYVLMVCRLSPSSHYTSLPCTYTSRRCLLA